MLQNRNQLKAWYLAYIVIIINIAKKSSGFKLQQAMESFPENDYHYANIEMNKDIFILINCICIKRFVVYHLKRPKRVYTLWAL